MSNLDIDPLVTSNSAALIVGLNQRYRFTEIDNFLTAPTDDEIIAAISDSLQDVNSVPPASNFNWDFIINGTDERWIRYVYMASAINILTLLISDWTANGYTVELEEITVESKLSEYESLRSSLIDSFKEAIVEFKLSAQRRITGATQPRRGIIDYQTTFTRRRDIWR